MTVTAPEDAVTTDEEGGRLLPHAFESSLLHEGAEDDVTPQCPTLALPPVSGGLSCSITELVNTPPPPADGVTADFVFPETKAAEEPVGVWECCWWWELLKRGLPTPPPGAPQLGPGGEWCKELFTDTLLPVSVVSNVSFMVGTTNVRSLVVSSSKPIYHRIEPVECSPTRGRGWRWTRGWWRWQWWRRSYFTGRHNLEVGYEDWQLTEWSPLRWWCYRYCRPRQSDVAGSTTRSLSVLTRNRVATGSCGCRWKEGHRNIQCINPLHCLSCYVVPETKYDHKIHKPHQVTAQDRLQITILDVDISRLQSYLLHRLPTRLLNYSYVRC